MSSQKTFIANYTNIHNLLYSSWHIFTDGIMIIFN